MEAQEARVLGQRVSALVESGQTEPAYGLLAPILAERTPFAILRRIAEPVGAGPSEPVNVFLERVAAGRTEGGWVVIAKVLGQQLDRDLPGALARCRRYILAADVWYGADTLGEGVVGQALVHHFDLALEVLASWREDPNAWVRRAVGTGVHLWAKRSRGAVGLAPQAEALLRFLEPLFGEWEMDTVKGVGWGLKTLGRNYPDLVAAWLPKQVGRRHRALMLRKAMTGLSEEQRERVLGVVS